MSAAESIPDLISAQTVQAAESALSGLQVLLALLKKIIYGASVSQISGFFKGGLSTVVKRLRDDCIDILVEMEARLDFDDELPVLDSNNLVCRIETMSSEIDEALRTAKRGKLMQDGMQVSVECEIHFIQYEIINFQIAIVGRPNVGKSSLLNAWSNVGELVLN